MNFVTRVTCLLIGLLNLCATAAFAQSEEIIVSASRLTRSDFVVIPAVNLKRKADFMVLRTYVISDSRDKALRIEEVTKTLRAIAKKAAGNKNIELGLIKRFETDDDEIEYIVPFDPSDIDEQFFTHGGRVDTTRTTIVAKTPIKQSDDDPGAIVARLERFLESVPVTGRAIVSDDGDPNLSVVNPNQYRPLLIDKIAQDNAQIIDSLGPAYGIEVSGLEQPVRWQVTGPLELTLYFSYKSAAIPK